MPASNSTKLSQKEKAHVFDAIKKLLNAGMLEVLLKEDDTGDTDFQSVADMESLIVFMPMYLKYCK
jgi:hypothetical protein